jgi:predicted phosphoribosyltransferase
MQRLFANRREAGRILAENLKQYAHRGDVIVLALPRGGVPVAAAVAEALDVPMDVYLVRKLGVPGHEELAMGAIATGGVTIVNEDVVRSLGLTAADIVNAANREQREMNRRENLYRRGRGPTDVQGKIAILVDDGLATGSTMRAAVAALKRQQPAKIVVAVPVAAAETIAEFRRETDMDEVVCVMTPEPFRAVGLWYEDFSQTVDEEVREILYEMQRRHPVQSQ